jgi:hypothetical protein
MVTTQEEQIFPLKLHLIELQFFDFWCDNGGPDVRDVQIGLADQMVQQRCVGWFLVFPVIFFIFCYWWGGTKSLGTTATSGLLYKPQMIDEDDFWSNWWNEDWQEKSKYSEKTCTSATLSTTKSHMTRPRLEPRTAAVGSQWLTAWAMARPCISCMWCMHRGRPQNMLEWSEDLADWAKHWFTHYNYSTHTVSCLIFSH